MLVQHKLVDNKGIFYVGSEGAFLAEMVYNASTPGKMIIEHTEVDESLAGKKIGKQLVATGVEYARNHQLKIIPLCPFAKAIFDKVDEFKDVLA
jgi:uncharacterized protein